MKDRLLIPRAEGICRIKCTAGERLRRIGKKAAGERLCRIGRKAAKACARAYRRAQVSAVRSLGILAAVLLCVLLPGTETRAAEAGTSGTETGATERAAGTAGREIPQGMELIASNEYLELYLDEEAAEFAVRVKETGDVWFTNPPEGEEDPLASSYYKGLMKSQFSIRYYNESVQASEMDSYNDAVAEGQFSVERIQDGAKIVYNLGELADKYVLPQIITVERYEQFTSAMDEKTARSVGRNYLYLNKDELRGDELEGYLEKYPVLEEYPVYVLREEVKDYKKEEMTEYFQAAGYTAQEMEQDNQANGFEAANEKPWFNVTVSYYLEGDGFVAELDPSTVEYDTEKYHLVDIDLLEYFGAAGPEDEGYLFVPDGSGALIRFNNGKAGAPSYIGYVYGEDKTGQVNIAKKPEIDQDVTVRMPVFGLKNGDAAFFAIVEGGAAGADINGSVAGKTDSYNAVYAGFSYLSYGAISLGDMVGNNSFQMYSQPVFSENFKVRYSFLHGDRAGYPGMASYYQDYLTGRGELTRNTRETGTPFYIDFVGAVQKWDSILGIKTKITQELTTYAQAADAVGQLQEAGVEYSGWSSGGLHGRAPGGVKALGSLNGSGMGQKDFIRAMEQKGIPVFHTAQLQYVYQDGFFDGYRSESHAPRYYDNTAVETGEYLIPNGIKDSTVVIDMISPCYVEKMADTFLKKTGKYNLAGVSVESLACDLFSDFNTKNYADRQAAAAYNCGAMEKLSQAVGGELLGSNANDYAWKYLSDVKNVPLDSNRSQIIDEVVPFYGMVLHGCRDYAGGPVNLSSDVDTMVLKSIEAGAGLSFEWICGDNALLKDTEFDGLYSVNFGDWKEEAVEAWHRVDSAIGDLGSLRITNHEKVSENVYCTTYEDGTRVVVNYGGQDAQYEGKTVKAQDFLVVKEG